MDSIHYSCDSKNNFVLSEMSLYLVYIGYKTKKQSYASYLILNALKFHRLQEESPTVHSCSCKVLLSSDN